MHLVDAAPGPSPSETFLISKSALFPYCVQWGSSAKTWSTAPLPCHCQGLPNVQVHANPFCIAAKKGAAVSLWVATVGERLFAGMQACRVRPPAHSLLTSWREFAGELVEHDLFVRVLERAARPNLQRKLGAPAGSISHDTNAPTRPHDRRKLGSRS